MMTTKHKQIYLWMCCWASVCMARAADPNVPVEAEQNDLLIAEMPTTSAERQLWKARISASEPEQDDEIKNQLQELIKKVGSIQFDEIESVEHAPVEPVKTEPVVQPTPQPVIAVEPVEVVEPNVVAKETVEAPVEVKSKRPEGYISDETLAIFQQMLDNPKRLKRPLELAEILYRSECYKEAGICYQAALDQMTVVDEDTYGDRAWVLYQLGNCLSKDDPLAAMNQFQLVIKEYPNCPWAELARAKAKVIDWQLKDKPVVLISECNKL
ncbi:MAG: tetratricopeptide repeat protein [Planctomycetota bacterium]|jgi:tetratricopeptide (TPR) repeat protein